MEELTSEQLNELSSQLVDARSTLEKELIDAAEVAKPVDLNKPIGRLSRMDALQQQQMEKAHLRRIELRLERVKIALIAIERGDYGYCQLCEDPIGYARLTVIPESPICVACKAEVEQS